jgi:proteic killer suppression protein
MEIHFNNTYLEKIYLGLPVSGKPRYNIEVTEKFRKRIVLLENIENIADLRNFKGLNFEPLKGTKKGLYSIRIDMKYRLEFSIGKNKVTLLGIIIVKDLSNHYR